MAGKRVLSVGQCGFDHANLTRTFRTHFAAEVVATDTATEAWLKLRGEQFDLILVNRVLDSDGTSGLDLIRQFRADEHAKSLAVMLVSNYDDAQEEAVASGALPGFGKSSLGQPLMIARVQAALGPAQPS
jgi:two-component system chemotaxis response regulator CheY